MVDVQEEKGGYEVPMRDHISRFYNLLRDEYVRIRVDIRRTMGDGTTYFDGSSFSNDVAKAISDAVQPKAERSEPVAWHVKDFADGWITFYNESDAIAEASGNGAIIQPLYTSPPTSELEALQRDRDESARAWRKYGDDMHQRAMTAEARVAELESRVAELDKVLIECEEYFDNRAGADHDGIGFVANEEMKLQVMIRRVREGGKVE
jgi:hypothetical protein